MSNSVERGLARRELSSEKIISINIDEKSYKKGHNYITVISQQTRNRVLEVGKERTLEATESLLNTTFTEEQLSSLKAVCVDMWDPFISAIKKSVHKLKLFTINFTSSSILIKG